jgi:TrmH family RNA methyltransferase
MNDFRKSASSVAHFLTRIRQLSIFHRRQAEGCFWIEGIRNFVQASDAGWPIETIVHSPILLKGDLPDMLIRRLVRAGVRHVKVTPEEFRSICTMERASGVGAIVPQRWTRLEAVDPAEGLFLLAIERIRSPGNLGTILRTARACGAGAMVLIGDQTDPFDPAVVRAAMGALMHLKLVRTTAEEAARWFAEKGVQVIGLSPEAAEIWTAAPIRRPAALVLGEERKGLSAALRGLCSGTIRLPMSEGVDSINVAIAGGVVMYEMVRRGMDLNPSPTP